MLLRKLKMSRLYDLQELVEKTRLPERTVRYYLNKVLDAPGGTRGRKAFYTQETLDQLKLAKQVLMREYDPKRGEVKPTLVDFKRWLRTLSASEVSEMVDMPYRIKPKVLMEASAPMAPRMRVERQESIAADIPPEAMFSRASSRQKKTEDKKKGKDSAARYLDKVMGRSQAKPPQHEWQRFRFGDDLEIRTRTRLTAEQHEQLRLAGKLLQSVLKGRST
jgi:hypothetical protein